jgi:hypothetical protein
MTAPEIGYSIRSELWARPTLHVRKALQGLAASGHPFRVSFRATAQARSPCSCRKCVPLAVRKKKSVPKVLEIKMIHLHQT